MEKPAEITTPPAEKHPASIGFIVWPFAVLLLYALSYGPYEKFQERGTANSRWYLQMSARIYLPLGWVYRKTLFHKPMGMYYHLWLPRYFDAKGNEI